VLLVEQQLLTLHLSNCRSFPHSWLITGFVTRVTRRVPLVEQEQLTPSEQLSSPPVISVVRVTRSLVLCVCFVDSCLSFCPFSFGNCVVCPSFIYGFWLHLGIFKLFFLLFFYFVLMPQYWQTDFILNPVWYFCLFLVLFRKTQRIEVEFKRSRKVQSFHCVLFTGRFHLDYLQGVSTHLIQLNY
jgi:hypothetical protein